MSHELYFLPIITDALSRSNPAEALADAFERIEAQGREASHRRGHRQFLRFMSCSFDEWEQAPIPELGTATAPEAAAPPGVGIVLEREGRFVAELRVVEFPARRSVPDLAPGRYRLTTDTGWLLWEHTLTARELIWTQAFPRQGLPLAAQTSEASVPPTLETRLLGGTVIVRVVPGLERGVLELILVPGRDVP